MFVRALPAPARDLLTLLGRQPQIDPFYLAGGSAAALHLGHRISVDLDFFTSSASYDAESLIQGLKPCGPLVIQQQGPGTLIGNLSGVRISFFVYPYPVLEEAVSHEGIRIAALLDIALMKLVAVAQRGTRRDFVDLYFICRSGLDLPRLMSAFPRKYEHVTYPAYHVLRALVYFADAEREEMPRMLVPLGWDEVKRYFTGEVPKLVPR